MTKFSTIVADPPWQVAAGRPLGKYVIVDGIQKFGPRSDTSRKLAYPSMTIPQICALPVSEVAADNAHLYLWTINKFIDEAFDVARAWGFKYSTLLTWAKNPMGNGLGGTYGISTEFCLFCRRGSLATTRDVNTTWFNWKRPYKNGYPNHSAKPPEFYDLVESVSPGSRLEMFARSPRDGWASWGNEFLNSASTEALNKP